MGIQCKKEIVHDAVDKKQPLCNLRGGRLLGNAVMLFFVNFHCSQVTNFIAWIYINIFLRLTFYKYLHLFNLCACSSLRGAVLQFPAYISWGKYLSIYLVELHENLYKKICMIRKNQLKILCLICKMEYSNALLLLLLLLLLLFRGIYVLRKILHTMHITLSSIN